MQVEVDHGLVAGTPLGEVEGDGSSEVAGRVPSSAMVPTVDTTRVGRSSRM